MSPTLDACIEAAVADAQAILDAISLEVSLAYRGVVAAHERIDLARTAVLESTALFPHSARTQRLFSREPG